MLKNISEWTFFKGEFLKFEHCLKWNMWKIAVEYDLKKQATEEIGKFRFD